MEGEGGSIQRRNREDGLTEEERSVKRENQEAGVARSKNGMGRKGLGSVESVEGLSLIHFHTQRIGRS